MRPKLTKKLMNAKYVKQHESMFTCPICYSSMRVVLLSSLICTNNHTFDFTKQGYVNLLQNQVKTKYRKDLFESRRNLIITSRFFALLTEEIAHIIKRHTDKKESLTVLDAGCGEGSHLITICNKINSRFSKITRAGIDISKEGVLVAAKHYPNNIWCVADIADPPFKASQFDVILNILSPAKYEAFQSLLKENGLIIKVVPQSNYLKELREAIHGDIKKDYTNNETVERFYEHFSIVDHSRLRYTIDLEQSCLDSLVKMTPLSWTAATEQITAFTKLDSSEITVDLNLLIGRKTK
ncbi:putative RNA methyltransferase [Evansella halocellulosilytica]|uniref:putative RNA methyltransferase n=1 Tax=Evansella halocellulosilytica TaxID=2011013 RepID=UPI00211C3C2D|nr:methyltransferase domain-containing protein [Evansella halocellulosilytica]